MSMKCFSSSSLFLSTLVATGKIKHNEMNREHEATMSRIRSVLFTWSEMFELSCKMAFVLSFIEESMLLSTLVRITKTDVEFLLI